MCNKTDCKHEEEFEVIKGQESPSESVLTIFFGFGFVICIISCVYLVGLVCGG